MTMLNIIDVFSGGGGLSEGFRSNSKFNIICHIEKDFDACRTLETREAYYSLKENSKLYNYRRYLSKQISREELLEYVSPERLDSILNYEINATTLPKIFEYIDKRGTRIDGIVGGPPCQAFSTIGRAMNEKKKESDERIYLYKYYLEFLGRYNPKFFVFENVKGLLSFKDLDGNLLLPKIIEEFQSYGYDVTDRVINSSQFGVSQNRERLFLFGIRNDLTKNNVFFDELAKYAEVPPNLDELFRDLPSINAGESSNSYRAIRLSNFKKKYYRNLEERIPLTYHSARPNISRDLEIYKIVALEKSKGNNIKYSDLPLQLRTHSNLNSFLDRFKALDANSISHTVVAHISKDGHYYIHPQISQNRSISVREAARIQGFPDNYFFESSRTAAFKQIGNAVPPILSKKIAQTIIDIGL